ncbi:hypothetical protein BS47DRAFT_1088570 [Hydnum rufescens UP504]|uniref:Uncharacterized protein n=1 Tax=Hydnum rufescens UP504 TaxID=1448309 RepID=A0A9P6AUK9_9AGAM|nr:hypothetical protein BS47DRAFT_1088570 [Hydnum rufescens UP504]
MAAVNRFFGDVYPQHPDDNTVKEVRLQAAGMSYPGYGDRHVLLEWTNRVDDKGQIVTQILQLTGQSGNYSYYAPVAKYRSASSRERNAFYSLGSFTRVQRDQILMLAKSVQFSKSSTTNGCRVWTRDLLEAMVEAKLISVAKFKEFDEGVPLVKRVAEAEESSNE